MITDKEFEEWLEHPVTAAVRDYCKRRRQDVLEHWASASPTEYLKETYVAGHIAEVGSLMAFKEIQELKFDDLIGVLNERE